MRETLVDALAGGPPYQVCTWRIRAVSQIQVLNELVRRGLITRDPKPVLTDSGIAEAKWFVNYAKSESVEDSPAQDADEETEECK